MDRMKTFFKYAIWIVLFFIFSEIMINLNIDATYKDISRKSNLSQVKIYQAQATKINGRIKGSIYNDTNNKITNKYLRIDLYSARDILLGSKYIDLSNMKENETKDIEAYFKVQDVKYFDMKFVDEKEEGELPEMFKDLSKNEIFIGTLLTYLVFF